MAGWLVTLTVHQWIEWINAMYAMHASVTPLARLARLARVSLQQGLGLAGSTAEPQLPQVCPSAYLGIFCMLWELQIVSSATKVSSLRLTSICGNSEYAAQGWINVTLSIVGGTSGGRLFSPVCH